MRVVHMVLTAQLVCYTSNKHVVGIKPHSSKAWERLALRGIVSGETCFLEFSFPFLSLSLSLPVGFPDVDGFGVGDPMLRRLVIQKVEEVLDGQRNRPAGAENHLE